MLMHVLQLGMLADCLAASLPSRCHHLVMCGRGDHKSQTSPHPAGALDSDALAAGQHHESSNASAGKAAPKSSASCHEVVGEGEVEDVVLVAGEVVAGPDVAPESWFCFTV